MKKILTICIAALFVFSSSNAMAAGTVFYLKLVSGQCYSFNSSTTAGVRIETTGKTLYPKSCYSKHHIQVIKVGTVRKSGTITQDNMAAFCEAGYKAKFKKNSPVNISSGAKYLRWFFADPGPELKKYGRIGICYIHQADSNYFNYTVMTKKY